MFSVALLSFNVYNFEIQPDFTWDTDLKKRRAVDGRLQWQ
jgi:hypothetical protein